MNKKSYEQKIKAMLQNKSVNKMCYVCGEDHPLILRKAEKHHLRGKAYKETVLLCPNCHAKITSEQNKLSPDQRSNKNKSKIKKLGYILLSIGSLLRLIGEQLIKKGHEILKWEK